MFLSSISGLPSDEITIGELAQEKGYATGFIGEHFYISFVHIQWTSPGMILKNAKKIKKITTTISSLNI